MSQSQKRKHAGESDRDDDEMVELGPPMARLPAVPQQMSPLAHLPHELLVQIIEPILIRDKPLVLFTKGRFVNNKKSTRANAWSPLVSILLACRAMYFAGVEVFYGRNTLHFVEALHLRKLVENHLNHDQRWSVTGIRLNVSWQRGRSSNSPWRLLHDCDSSGEWRDVPDALPKLRKVVIRNTTEFSKEDLKMQLDTVVFEQRMREEIGSERADLLEFEWPSTTKADV